MTAVDITKQIHKLGCQQKLKDYLQHPAVESQAAAYQVCLKFWLWISFNLLTRLNHPDQAQTEKLEMTALLSILFPFFLSLVVGIGNYICNYTNISGLSMAKKKFKTAKSRDFPHVCIKREKLGLLPSYVMTLSFLARQKKTIGYAACSACTKSRSFQHPEVSNVSKRQFHRFCHHNSVETCRNYENPESIIHSKTHTQIVHLTLKHLDI